MAGFIDFLPVIGVVVAVAAGTITSIATIIGQKKSMVKEVKEHTEQRVTLTETKLTAVGDLLKVKLENLEHKVGGNEDILNEIKKINKDEVEYLKKELDRVREELSDIQENGSAAAVTRIKFLEDKVENISKKIDLLWERALTDETSDQRRRRRAPVG